LGTMTAKQLLHEFVERLSDDDALVSAALLIPDAERSLREDEKAAIDQGLAEADAGEMIALEEIEREFGIA
ncbi:MAG: hypothetical protein IH609_16580, partial [Dehalococcoidia bacterium]|nr:hypothetical protein [Dehalococcoidia bacterium]